MTAVRSVSEIKRGAKNPAKSGAPRPGTRLRAMYDEFRTGRVVDVSREFGTNGLQSIVQLRDFYGMDIESLCGGYRLVGEWEGPYYVPIERIVSL